ncbi:MAG TPA: Rha family transcriptional regulator [Desulfitobacterium dehalogenans]|uniref:Rha family transcriptional regulator n=1 Tax=Desulfitobacterium dehalogenans TaxID=36854 RepID=A0A7C6Z4U0_9FIRM|nr:Rha family transcriptional regulator [Desulfitobacterium dehalogenans]
MKLLLNPEFNLYERKGKAFCSSRQVAEEFNRRHDHILRNIDDLTAPTSGVSDEFRLLNFEESTYKDSSGKKNREYLMAKDGFAMVAMELKGKRARQFKETYIQRFNAMEEFIKSLASTKIEFPAFTDAIMLAHEEPKHYHFSNEINMIYRIVLGMDAKAFREANGLEPGTVIKPYLSLEQIKAIENLQRVDIGLIEAIPDFQERKERLGRYYGRIRQRQIA